MTRNSNIIARLTSVKGIAALSLVLTALVLPACGVGEEDGVFDEGDAGTEEEVFEEERNGGRRRRYGGRRRAGRRLIFLTFSITFSP